MSKNRYGLSQNNPRSNEGDDPLWTFKISNSDISAKGKYE